MTSEGGAGPPAGWYGDPNDPTAWRYWDGRSWTEHVAPRIVEPSPHDRLIEERRWARYAKWAFVGLVPAQIGAQVFGALQTEDRYHGTLFTDDAPSQVSMFEPAEYALPQLACAALVLAATFVLAYWCMQAARAAQAQGIPIVRSPGWALAGWFIPIVNFWFPPQTIRSFAHDRTQLRHVVGWWVCWIVATLSSVAAVFVAGAEDFDSAIPFLVVGAAGVASFALLGRQVVDLVLYAHEHGVGEPAGEGERTR